MKLRCNLYKEQDSGVSDGIQMLLIEQRESLRETPFYGKISITQPTCAKLFLHYECTGKHIFMSNHHK